MIGLIYLYLTAAALVLLQCGLEATHIDKSNMDNSFEPNRIPSPTKKRRMIRNFVSISDPPPETVRHVPGTDVEIECHVLGKPAPSIEWLKNGEPFNDFEEDTNDLITHSSSIIRVTSRLVLTAPSDGDEYTCVAMSGLKRTTATTTVTTNGDEDEAILDLEKLFFKPSKPVISYYYNEVLQNEGTEIVLPCRVDGNTKTQIIWQDSDYNIIYGDSGRFQVLPSGDLLIKNLKWSHDMGNFTCTAKNIYGKDTAFTFMYPLKME